jgi:translation initiation factor IF-2
MARVKIITDYIFRNRNPYIVGVEVLEGNFRVGDKIVFDNGDTGNVIAIQKRAQERVQALLYETVAIAIEGVHWKKSNERGHATIIRAEGE